MTRRRVAALVEKELRELRWMLLVLVPLTFWPLLQPLLQQQWTARMGFAQQTPRDVITAGVYLSIAALVVANRQGAELGSGTRRHLLTFPVRPWQVLTAKVLALVVTLVPVMLAAFVVCGLYGPADPQPWATANAVATGVLAALTLAIVFWSFELLSSAWPRTGAWFGLAVIGWYVVALLVLPWVRHYLNIFNLLFLDRPLVVLVGGTLTALAASFAALAATAQVIRVSRVE
jgi:hypothetical protein